MATIKEIAAFAGVSIGTVSNVLNGLPSVRKASQARVLEAIEQLGYQPSLLGRALRKDKTNMIVVVVPDITNPFFPSAVRGAEDVAFANGFRVVLCNSDNDYNKESTYLREMRTYRPSGLIIVPSSLSRGIEEAKEYLTAGSSVVYMDRIPLSWSGDSVTCDHEAGALVATRHLIALGHKRIAIISGPLAAPSAKARLNGFRKAMRAAGLPILQGYERESQFNKIVGHEKAAELIMLKPRPTAIFAANDLIAFGALAAIREAGLRCPKDISLIGFDNLDDSDATVPALTTIDQSVYQLGANAAQTVIDRNRLHDNKPRHVLLLPELRIKESTAAPLKERKVSGSP